MFAFGIYDTLYTNMELKLTKNISLEDRLR